MGFLDKDRTGVLQTVTGTQNRAFLWRLTNPFKDMLLGDALAVDSPKHQAFGGVPFHVRLTCEQHEIGIILHYKSPPIPKYWAAIQNPRGQIIGQVSANDPPAGGTRCGHSKVCTYAEFMQGIGGRYSGGNFLVSIIFDDDLVQTIDNDRYAWHIKNVSRIPFGRELESRILHLPLWGPSKPPVPVFFKLVVDEGIEFRIAHKDDVPVFCFTFFNTRREALFASTSGMTRPSRDLIVRQTAGDDTLVVSVSFSPAEPFARPPQPTTAPSTQGLVAPSGTAAQHSPVSNAYNPYAGITAFPASAVTNSSGSGGRYVVIDSY